MKNELVAAIAGILIIFAESIFYMLMIFRAKKELKRLEKEIPKASASYVSSIILCFLTSLLPFIIPLKFFVIIIVELCAIFGLLVILKDRTNSLK